LPADRRVEHTHALILADRFRPVNQYCCGSRFSTSIVAGADCT